MVKKVLDYLSSINKDSLLHFSAGVMITSVLSLFIAPWLAFMATTLVALCKEVYDHYTGGNVELWDIIVTMFGGMVVLVPITFL